MWIIFNYHSKISFKFYKWKKSCVAFITVYSFLTNPDEKYFALLKQFIKKKLYSTINLKNRESMEPIKNMMQLIPSKLVIVFGGIL